MTRRAIVIGAGPMGLEAALGALERGLDVTVLEKSNVGAALRRWGSTRFFSPFSMNVSERARRILGHISVPDDALLTGPELVRLVLEPLASQPPLAGRIRTGHRVVAVGRARMKKSEMPGHPLRAERPFRVLVETPKGEETLEAEVVLDASGCYDRPASLGAGGIPARGERSHEERIVRHLGTLEAKLPELAGRRILLVGHGHSAANAIGVLDRVAREAPSTRITWAVRSPNRRPCVEVASDPLPERREVVLRANRLAEDPPTFLSVERRAHVESIEPGGGGDELSVRFSGGRDGLFDAIAAFTGYGPDLSFLSEVALEVSPSTEGALRLHRALANVTDCMSVPSVRAEDLASGELGFHLVGWKSYGRLPTFLLKTGLAQLETLLDLLAREHA